MKNNVSLTHVVTAFFLSFILFLSLPILIVNNSLWKPHWSTSWPCWVILLWACVAILAARRINQPAMLTGTFWLYMLVFFGVAGVLQIGSHTYPRTGSVMITNTEFYFAGLIGLLACMGFSTGTWLSSTLYSSKKNKLALLLDRSFSWRRTIFLAMISLPITAVLIAFLGVDTLFLSRNANQAELVASTAGEQSGLVLPLLLRAAIRLPIYAVTISFTILRITGARTTSGKRFVSIPLLCVAWTIMLVLNNPIVSPRFWIGSILIAMFILYFGRKDPKKEVLLLSALAIIFVFVFPYADVFRNSTNIGDTVDLAEQTTAFGELTQKGDYDSLQQSAVAISYAHKNGFLYGGNIVGAALFPVPRVIWQNKPQPSGALMADYMGFGNTAISMPLFSEYYLAGGPFVVFFGMLLTGGFVRRMELGLLQDVDTRFLPIDRGFLFAIYAVTAGQMILLWRGTLVAALSNIIPLLCVLFLCSERNRQTQEIVQGV